MLDMVNANDFFISFNVYDIYDNFKNELCH